MGGIAIIILTKKLNRCRWILFPWVLEKLIRSFKSYLGSKRVWLKRELEFVVGSQRLIPKKTEDVYKEVAKVGGKKID